MKGPVPLALRVAIALLAGGELADRDGLVLLAPLLGHDVPAKDVAGEDGARTVGGDLDGQVVDLLDILDPGDEGLHVGAVGAGALPGEDHIVGREGRAVMELDVGAQLEAPDIRVQEFPLRGQRPG